jgi:hypothetical protein
VLDDRCGDNVWFECLSQTAFEPRSISGGVTG